MLSPTDLRRLEALCDALVPRGGDLPLGAADAGTGARIARWMDEMPRATALQLRALLRLWDLGPLASPHLRPFRRLSPEARVAWLAAREQSGMPWRQIPVVLLKTLVLTAFCADVRVEAALGYDHRCLDASPRPPGPRLAPLQHPDVHGEVAETADVCVVGSGAGGAVAARELARGGLRVVVLEEGGYFTREDLTGPPVERVRRAYRDGGATIAFGRPIIPVPLGMCVGGTTVVNSGTCFRTPDRVLAHWEATDGIEGADPASMGPLFDEIAARIGVQPVPWEIAGRNAELFDHGARALGIQGGLLDRNISGCRGCGQCAFGCPSDAKQAMHLTYLPDACAAGTRLYARCRVERVLLEDGRATGVVAALLDRTRDEIRGRLTVRAPLVVVAAGALHTPVLLARSGVRHPRLGRNLRLHPAVGVAAYFDEEVFAWRGTLQSYAVDRLAASRGVMIEVTNPVPGVSASALPGVGPALADRLARLRHAAAAGLFVSDTGAGRVIGMRGRRSPLVTYRLARADARALCEGIALVADIFFAAGARSIHTGVTGLPELRHPRDAAALRRGDIPPARLRPTGFHPMGTAAMSAHPMRGVTDPWGAVRGTHGLYVADASLFPSCVGVNPQVSIMAFATRIARRLAEGRTRRAASAVNPDARTGPRSS